MRSSIHIISIIVLATSAGMAVAGPGHDHGHEEASVASSSGPKRLPDGSVYLPKLSQRQLSVRTVLAERREHPQSFELVGKVAMDPNAGGRVQPTMPGRIEAGPNGLPSLGQAVRKGQVLAYVVPSTGTLERAGQAAQAAELRAARTLAEKRLARLKQLEGSVPQKDIEAAQAEYDSTKERLAAISGSLSAKEALLAPANGVIASANAVAGQVVDAREVLFEIVDPNRLRIEAVAYDARQVNDMASAFARSPDNTVMELEPIGMGRILLEQAIPVHFRIRAAKGSPPALTIGQPVKVVAQSRSKTAGVAVPAGAIVKNASNQDSVWVHAGAEQFFQKTVRHVSLDGANVLVLHGLNGGERVVVQGAPLVNQVR